MIPPYIVKMFPLTYGKRGEREPGDSYNPGLMRQIDFIERSLNIFDNCFGGPGRV